MATVNLPLSAEEWTYLEGLVDSDLREVRVEVRRTDTPDWHDALQLREKMIRGLLEKLHTKQTPASKV
jgi:hypothetical protein